METKLSRREFIGSAALAAGMLALPGTMRAAHPDAFSFLLIGDLHFDRLSHHDMDWLRKNKPDDVRQVEDYSNITRQVTPGLFARLREVVRREDNGPKVKFALQVGDLVEGLCGTEELAAKQNSEALQFVQNSRLEVPFVFTKGNHDITGDGAAAAFKNVLEPFMAKQARAIDPKAEIAKACHSFRCGDALFCCFDAYDKESLPWLEAALAKRTERHCFVVIHPPVVPYGARATWYLFSRTNQKPERDKVLSLLAKQNAMVLGGHLHKYNALVRDVPGQGRFVQLAVSSIIRNPDVSARDVLSPADYNADQVKVEPNYSPSTEAERRAVYVSEAPFVREFQYADVPGYAVMQVSDSGVEVKIFPGTGETSWRTVNLTKLLKSPAQA